MSKIKHGSGSTRRKIVKILCTVLVISGLVAIAVALIQNSPMPTAKDTTSRTIVTNDPLIGVNLYVDPVSNAARQAQQWRAERPEDAALMSKLAAMPSSTWLTANNSLDDKLVPLMAAAKTSKSTPVVVVYNIPQRDCGLYSSGGAQSINEYQTFIDRLAQIIGDSSVILIIEPDALAALSAKEANGKACLNGEAVGQRYQALRYAVEHLSQLPAGKVYVDAGNSAWAASPDKAAERLQKAGIDAADGFSLNVSNFQPTPDTLSYGKDIAAQLGGKHFVIDTSRNGAGPYENPKYKNYNWCNPPGRALGHYPTTQTGETLVDAYLYVKNPGESDGNDPDPNKCHGGPKAGEWWPDYALGLVRNWPKKLQAPSAR
jgi:endoglucanase